MKKSPVRLPRDSREMKIGASLLACRPGIACVPTKGYGSTSDHRNCKINRAHVDRLSLATASHFRRAACFSTRRTLVNNLITFQLFKKTFWRNMERCYKGFIAQYHRTSVKLSYTGSVLLGIHSFDRRSRGKLFRSRGTASLVCSAYSLA